MWDLGVESGCGAEVWNWLGVEPWWGTKVRNLGEIPSRKLPRGLSPPVRPIPLLVRQSTCFKCLHYPS